VLSEQTDGLVKGGRFGVLADGGELSHRLRMVDPLHSLFDDGALVEVDSDEVGRRANELDPGEWAWRYGLAPLKPGRKE